MPTAPHIALVTRTAATAQAVAAALGGHRAPACTTFGTLDELTAHLRQSPMAAAIVDIDPNRSEGLARLTPIVSQYPDTRFIVLSNIVDNKLMLQAMEVGARHFLSTESIASDLLDVLQRLVMDGAARNVERRNIVPVLSASGGCGGTTVAINLTNELHLVSGKPALLVDLDCHFGVADTYLGLTGAYGLTDVLARPGEIDADLVRSTAVDYSDGFHLLRSPATSNLPSESPLDRERLSSVIAACTDAYAFTVIDAPRVPMSVAAELASNSALTFLILQLTVKDLRVARSILSALMKRDISPDRIVPVINRYSKRGMMITAEDARKALGRPFGTISNDYRNTVRSINYGQPLERTAPRCQCRRELQDLAERVVQASVEPQPSPVTR